MKLTITPSTLKGKKWKAFFSDDEHKKTIHFGSSEYQDFTQHNDLMRRKAYISRHQTREDWTTPFSAGSLSRWILWGDSTSFDKNVSDFKKRFHLD